MEHVAIVAVGTGVASPVGGGDVMTWLTVAWSDVWTTALSALFILAAVTAMVRVVGLRTLAKLNAVDFTVTVAGGAIVATTVVSADTSVLQGALGIGSLVAVQVVTSLLQRWKPVRRLLHNDPLLLMNGDRVLHDHLRQARVTEGELRAALRHAGVHDAGSVFAVVLETTGEMSVILGDGPYVPPGALDDVRGSDLLDPTVAIG